MNSSGKTGTGQRDRGGKDGTGTEGFGGARKGPSPPLFPETIKLYGGPLHTNIYRAQLNREIITLLLDMA